METCTALASNQYFKSVIDEIIPISTNAEFYYVYNDSSSQTTYYHYRANELGIYELLNGEGIIVEDNMITLSAITNDVIYIENASLLTTKYTQVRKYYVASADFSSGESTENTSSAFTYRIHKDYLVTGTFFSLQRQNANLYTMKASVKEGVLTSSLEEWASDTISLYFADHDLLSTIQAETYYEELKEFYKALPQFLTFTLDPTEGASGAAEIAENGTITFYDEFTYQQYLKIRIRMKVSGADRDITKDDNCGTIELGTINVAWAEDYRAINNSNG